VTPVPSGCPRCGAHSRPGAQWCTLCYTDLRATTVRARPERALVTVPQGAADLPEASVSLQEQESTLAEREPEPVDPAVAPAGGGRHSRHDPAEEPPPPPAPPAPGRGRRSAATDEDALGTEAMLALLAIESNKPLKGLAARLDSNATKFGVMAGGIVLFSLLLFLVMAVIGSVI